MYKAEIALGWIFKSLSERAYEMIIINFNLNLDYVIYHWNARTIHCGLMGVIGKLTALESLCDQALNDISSLKKYLDWKR